MNVLRFFVLSIMALLFAGCANVPRDNTWTGSYLPSATHVPSTYPTHPSGIHVGSMPFHVGSFGGSSTPTAYGQSYQQSAQAPVFQAMLPDTAREYLDKLDAMDPKPCSSGDHVKRTTIGTFVGLLVGQVLGGNTKATLAGGLIGALGGDASARMSCDRWSYLKLQFQLVIDQQNRCTGEVRSTNGKVTSDERCTYARRYTPQHQPPQIGR